MMLGSARATPFVIPFRRPLLIAGHCVRAHRGALVEVQGTDAVTGIAEAPAGAGRAGPCVAIEAADLDRQARARGARLAALLGGVRRERIAVNALLDASDPAACAAQAEAYAARGFRCLKLKLSPTDRAGNRARIAAARAAVGAAVALRADANAAWHPDEAVAALRPLLAYDLEYVEQPTASIEGLARVRRALPVAIAADESAVDAAAVESIAALGAADVIVVKTGLHGLRRAFAIAAAAARAGLDVVVTSALDTSIGIAAALHLAAAVDAPLRACGLATAELLADDLATLPLIARDGWLALPGGPGIGVDVDPSALERWRAR